MDKKRVITHLIEYLTEELNSEESPEKKKEIEALLVMYRFLPSRAYGAEDVIIPSTLVTLRTGIMTAFYFIVPRGGGLITQIDGRPLQVITPHSPLGESLMGKKSGESFKIDVSGTTREYEIVAVN